MSKTNLIGKVLNQVRTERWLKRSAVVNDLWKRNGLDNPAMRDNYKIETDVRVARNGRESTIYQLWQLVDQSELIIETKVSSEVVTGIPKKENGDGKTSGSSQANINKSPI